MVGAKKDRKNGKDGGVLAAVTKQAAGKFSKGNTPEDASSSPSPPTPAMSPDIKPTTVVPQDLPTASPLLDAVTTASIAASPGATELTRGPTSIAGSPGNLISLMGESPPTQPSSYEGARVLPRGWNSPRPVGLAHPMATSPPTVARRPLSYHPDAYYPPSDASSQTGASGTRRSSMHSPFSYARSSPHPPPNPPLPHQPQAHFFGMPEIDLNAPRQGGMKPGERGYFLGFDRICCGDTRRGAFNENAVIAGYEGGLEVHSVGKRGISHVASLSGLRGGVVHAKILPFSATSGHTPGHLPLIAVVIHGPVLSPRDADVQLMQGAQNLNLNGAPTAQHNGPVPISSAAVDFYQTTVEIFSLQTNKRVAVLLEAPRITLKTAITSPIFTPPPPTGALCIKADGGSILISSGATGECWVFRQEGSIDNTNVFFGCLGKVWTTIQVQSKGESSPEGEPVRNPVTIPPRPPSAIISINGNWLAYCPASPSSQLSMRATVAVPSIGKAPGLISIAPPHLPAITTDVDLPAGESVMNKIMRETTQELIQGARWVGSQGKQLWDNYWKSSNAQAPTGARSPPMGAQPWGNAHQARQDAFQFPPTHGATAPPVVKEPGLVSVVDVNSLGLSSTIHPIATFPAAGGCSFLSFSPTGLFLFAASSKGDVQTVWDLMRIQYTKGSPLQPSNLPTNANGPRVRQVAQFSRMTVAKIVDVAWTRPTGERAAMVTERGTVHLLELPASAFTWPPPRRRNRAAEATTAAMDPSNSATSATSYASGALTAAYDVAKPFINRSRRSSAHTPQVPGTIGQQAAHGGKVLVAGISQSLGKTAGGAYHHFRHAGETRAQLPNSAEAPSPSCVTWVTGRRDYSLFVLGDGLVRSFPNKSRRSASGEQRRRPKLSLYKDYKIPALPDDALAAGVQHFLAGEEHLDLADRDLEPASSTLVLEDKKRGHGRGDQFAAISSIPQAEIESSAPYQPFHTDRRVGLFEYTVDTTPAAREQSSAAMARQGSQDAPSKKSEKKKAKTAPPSFASTADAWAFGQPIVATKLDVGLPSTLAEDDGPDSTTLGDTRALPPSAMERILQHVGENDEQIVVTTRRRRGAAGRTTDGGDDGFFEDDCEVLDFADQRV